LEEEQKRRRDVEGKEINRSFYSKTEHSNKFHRDIRTIIASASSLTKKTGNPTAGADRTCTNGGSREDKCGHCKHELTGRVCAKAQLICDGSGSQ